MKKIIYILSATVVLLGGCKKSEFVGNDPTGEGLVDFTLIAPASGTILVLNAATPNAPVTISWNAARPGLITAPTYKFVAALKNGGNLNSPLIEIDVPGSATTLTITQKQLDDALKAKSIADGATTEFIWSVKATNPSLSILSTSIFNITITRMKDGASPFILLGPVPTTTPMEINPVSTTDQIKFNWTKSKPATGGPAVTYKVLFTNNNNFSTPLFSMTSANNGLDSLLIVTTKQMSDSLAVHGYADLSLQADLKWTVVATSGTWKQQADYINALSILRQIKFYLVGNITGWDINNPWEIITDKKADRYGKIFYTYIKMNAGDEFKFFKIKGDWGSGYGNNGASGAGFSTGYNIGGNFQIGANGIYRLTLDVENNMAYIQQKQVGIVGGMQGWNPTTPIYGGYAGRDKFIIVTNSAVNDEFKLHDGSAGSPWTFGIKDDRWWGDAGGGNLDYDGNGGNLNAGSTRVRTIWNGTNTQQVKYEKSPAVEMRVVGNGMQGVPDWNPGASPQMTYSGNGIWTITLTLVANKEIKFLAGNDWGAFDYEDNSGGSQATGTPRPIKWDGGGNFITPTTSGSYTITLNEHTQTVTIN
ncbi:MAG: SusE domain-containing protein [Chitinophagaceae bacterium]|nr:SusE domain-containing protein [Chitinophagaceae bacterium]